MKFTLFGRKYRVINNLRFAVALIVIVGIVMSVCSFGVTTVQAYVEEVIDTGDLEVVEVLIKSGDKAWDIQKELTPNRDIREMLFVGEHLNGKSLGEIQAGETVLFFMEK